MTKKKKTKTGKAPSYLEPFGLSNPDRGGRLVVRIPVFIHVFLYKTTVTYSTAVER
jgi:hypothetical protein